MHTDPSWSCMFAYNSNWIGHSPHSSYILHCLLTYSYSAYPIIWVWLIWLLAMKLWMESVMCMECITIIAKYAKMKFADLQHKVISQSRRLTHTHAFVYSWHTVEYRSILHESVNRRIIVQWHPLWLSFHSCSCTARPDKIALAIHFSCHTFHVIDL